jgi:hypothetical protein
MEEQEMPLEQRLHKLQDELEREVERRRELEWDLYASQIRCADALDALEALRSSAEIRYGKKVRNALSRIRRSDA